MEQANQPIEPESDTLLVISRGMRAYYKGYARRTPIGMDDKSKRMWLSAYDYAVRQDASEKVIPLPGMPGTGGGIKQSPVRASNGER